MTQTPQGTVEISYTDPLTSPEWEDETDRLRYATKRSGRSLENDQQQPGTAMFVMDNNDGALDPENASGVHFPDVRLMRQIRWSAEFESSTVPFTMARSSVGGSDVIDGGDTIHVNLFRGFIDSIEQGWTKNDSDAWVTITAVDGSVLVDPERFQWNQDHTRVFGEMAGARVNRVLDQIGWPAGDRRIDDGTARILDSDIEFGGSSFIEVAEGALDYLEAVAATEGGYFYFDTAGRARFIDAAHLPAFETVDVYGEQEQKYTGIQAPLDMARLFNVIEVTTTEPGLFSDEEVSDATSIQHYGTRPSTRLRITLLPATVDGIVTNVEQRAVEYLVRYREPHTRLPVLQLRPQTSDSWRQVLSKEIGDRVRVRRRPAGADMIQRDSVIEGVTITSPNRFDWLLEWNLSSVVENLLTFEQTSNEDSTAGWGDEVNCTLAAAGPSLIGADALRMTATGSGDMSTRTQPDTQIPVDEGRRYMATVYFRPITVERDVRIEISWRDSGGSEVATSAGDEVTDELGGFTAQAVVEAACPIGAAFGTIRLVVVSAGAGEVHAADLITFSPR